MKMVDDKQQQEQQTMVIVDDKKRIRMIQMQFHDDDVDGSGSSTDDDDDDVNFVPKITSSSVNNSDVNPDESSTKINGSIVNQCQSLDDDQEEHFDYQEEELYTMIKRILDKCLLHEAFIKYEKILFNHSKQLEYLSSIFHLKYDHSSTTEDPQTTATTTTIDCNNIDSDGRQRKDSLLSMNDDGEPYRNHNQHSSCQSQSISSLNHHLSDNSNQKNQRHQQPLDAIGSSMHKPSISTWISRHNHHQNNNKVKWFNVSWRN
nr:uncharacterized protein LOC124490332 [Dermatophagoides farinae]